MVELAERLLNSEDQVKRLSVVSQARRKVAKTEIRRLVALCPEQVRELAEAYESGLTIATLAASFGIDRSTVQRHLAASDTPSRYRKLSDEEVVDCARRYKAGESTVEIAADLGVHKDTVRRRVAGMGVEMRSGRFGERN